MLTAIWEEVLGTTGIGATDNFFDLGGHSLNLTTLVALIDQRLGIRTPLSLVFRSPTIRDVARALLDAARHGVSLADDAMVLLGGREDAPCVFALPPGTGDVLGYIPAAALWTGHRFYAFNFIEAATRLSDYADLISATQPEGPYVLFGYSSGGNLAFHVTRELERRGHRVSRIVMVDSGRTLSPYPVLEDEVMLTASDFLNHETIRPSLQLACST